MLKSREQPEIVPSTPTPESQPETLPSREAEPAVEAAPVQEEPTAEAPVGDDLGSLPVPAAPTAPVKDPQLMRVERVLEDELLDVYLAMTPDKRTKFKAAGEAAAVKINDMIERSRVKAKTVLKLILNWLKLIPGVNRYFLEQEAKLKTDRVMRLAEDREREKGETVV